MVAKNKRQSPTMYRLSTRWRIRHFFGATVKPSWKDNQLPNEPKFQHAQLYLAWLCFGTILELLSVYVEVLVNRRMGLYKTLTVTPEDALARILVDSTIPPNAPASRGCCASTTG